MESEKAELGRGGGISEEGREHGQLELFIPSRECEEERGGPSESEAGGR